MKRLAKDVWHLDTIRIPNAVNAYLLGDALIHAHPDHQGSSAEICTRLGVPYWVGERDVDAAEDPNLIRGRQPDHPVANFYVRIFTGPGHKVDRALREGDEVAGFRIIDAPGHSAGHVVFWREADGVL